MNKTLQREVYVATHAQPLWLRVTKYPVFIAIAIFLYIQYGWMGVLYWFLFWIVFGPLLHFFLRWKTQGWKKSWGPYKKIKLP